MISIGLLTSPLPFLLLGAVMGSALTIGAGLAVSEFVHRRRETDVAVRVALERRYQLALRDILAALDHGEDLRRIRRIARRGLYPQAIAFDDEPVIPEVSHG
ncbi:hypothetical protein ACO2RV_16940 [Ancylobacter sp. VNQ12]|uniref:hypothetical protein n=1 Tax=Ancylobacter sp. VNQ12 TaxID=3400920 RepID=UPI003C0C8B97